MANYLKPKAFGLDISDLSLKIIELEKAGADFKLACFGETHIPKGVIEGGQVKKEKELSELIKKAAQNLKGKKLKTKHVVFNLPEEKSFLDILQLPILGEEEMAEAVRFEAANHIPLPLEDVYFDFEKVPPTLSQPKFQEVLVAATPKEIVDPYLNALQQAGFRPQAAEVECSAVARSLTAPDKVQKPLLIVDLGETRTSFIIFSGRSLRFTSTIPISSGGFTESISKILKVDVKKAEKMKQQEGLEGKKKVFEALVPILTDLIEQIESHLEYYHSHSPKGVAVGNGKQLEKILLCGGGANLKGLTDFLASELKIEVKLGNPLINIEKPTQKDVRLPQDQALSYTTAIGLALRGVYGN